MTPPLIVYGSSLSPYVRKVLVIAAEKGLEVENRVAGPGIAPSEDFAAASPFKKIPALRDGDFTLADSTAIAIYLEAKQPAPNLVPTEAKARGRTLWFDEFADTIAFPQKAKIFFNRVVMKLMGKTGDEALAAATEREELPRLFAYLEGQIPASGFLVEDRFTLADIAVVSPFVNLQHAGVTPDAAAYPKTAAYVDAMLRRASFAALVEKDRRFLAR